VKYLCLLAVLLTLPVTATAQQRRNDDRRSNDRSSNERQSGERGERDRGERDRAELDRPSDHQRSGRTNTRGNPLVPSWEQKMTPWWERQGAPWWEGGGRSASSANTNRNNHNDDDRRRPRHNNGGVVYVVPSYPYFQDNPSVSTVATPPPPAQVITRVVPAPQPPAPAIGFLNLEVEPRALLQIYVDDVFMGTPADLGDELRLTPGTRRIELRAKGYKTLAFSAEIVENRSINYRGTLERDPSAAATPSAPAAVRPPSASGPTTMYMIQGCYLGNIAPKAAELRAGCDIAKLITFKP
jgi:hypothetical protein